MHIKDQPDLILFRPVHIFLYPLQCAFPQRIVRLCGAKQIFVDEEPYRIDAHGGKATIAFIPGIGAVGFAGVPAMASPQHASVKAAAPDEPFIPVFIHQPFSLSADKAVDFRGAALRGTRL